MFWLDKIANELGKNEIINDSKTPSGKVHVGSLRGLVLHYMIWKVLSEQNKEPIFYYGSDDYDPLDELPKEWDKESETEKWMGKPLSEVRFPNSEKSFGEHYMDEFVEVFQKLGIRPKLYRTSQLYKKGAFNEAIETLLHQAEKLRWIYFSVSHSKKPDNWHPFQVLCENCGKIGTTLVHSFQGGKVEYHCQKSLVNWAIGCNYRGRVSPFDGGGKLPWKLEWPAKWNILGVSVEGAGKDHCSKGGSWDVSSEIFRQIFSSKPPYSIPYEFFHVGKKKMSSSKGIGVSTQEIASLMPPELLRFLMIRYLPTSIIDFDPTGDTCPRLFDEYDRCAEMYFRGSEDTENFQARAFELAQLNQSEAYHSFRFSTLAFLIQIPGFEKNLEKLKGNPLNEADKQELENRVPYVKKWIDHFASESYRFTILETLPNDLKFQDSEKSFLQSLASFFESFPKNSSPSPEEIHSTIYEKSTAVGIKTPSAFRLLYKIFLGKTQGPKLGNFFSALGTSFVLDRILYALKHIPESTQEENTLEKDTLENRTPMKPPVKE